MSLKIRMQADDFFNAYLVLQENNSLTSKKAKTTALGSSPSVVCLAFSLELYIKDLHFILKGKAPHGHNILELYKSLPEKIQKEIFSHHSISQNPFITGGNIFSVKRYTSSYTPYDGFVDKIKSISNAFEKWRYSYEWASLTYEDSFTLALIEAIQSVSTTIRAQPSAQRNK